MYMDIYIISSIEQCWPRDETYAAEFQQPSEIIVQANKFGVVFMLELSGKYNLSCLDIYQWIV